MRRWKRMALVILLIPTLVIFLSCSLFQSRVFRTHRSPDEVTKLRENLKQVLSQLKMLRQRHDKLVARIREGLSESEPKDVEKLLSDDLGPTEEYELLRRRIYSNIKEFWYFVSYVLGKGLNGTLETERIQAILDDLAERKRSLLSDQEKLPTLDGYEDLRRSEAEAVSDLVQRRLRLLQNPPDCRNAKKLVCQHEDCGFGCQHHHLVYCLIFAYATKRTLILKRSNWEHNEEGWTNIFRPISETCTSIYNDTVVPASVAASLRTSHGAKVLSLSMLHELHRVGLPKLLPYYIPQDLARRISRFNSNPTSWWIGQMLKYILNPQSHIQAVIDDTIDKTKFDLPIVGVLVQLSDNVKFGEATFHMEKYMSHVDDFYAQLELTRAVDERRVYIATDDASVLNEAVEKYPQYTFYGYYSKAKWKDTRIKHYTTQALTGLLVDLHMLSLCDYVVATFSGNIGRMVYEMMQTKRMDATNSFTAIDHNIYYFFKRKHIRVAVIRNIGGATTTAFNIGDLIEVRYNYRNGTGYGTVFRTNASGLIPWYKTAEHLVLLPVPEDKRTTHTGTKQN